LQISAEWYGSLNWDLNLQLSGDETDSLHSYFTLVIRKLLVIAWHLH